MIDTTCNWLPVVFVSFVVGVIVGVAVLALLMAYRG